MAVVETQKGVIDVTFWHDGTMPRLVAQPGRHTPKVEPLVTQTGGLDADQSGASYYHRSTRVRDKAVRTTIASAMTCSWYEIPSHHVDCRIVVNAPLHALEAVNLEGLLAEQNCSLRCGCARWRRR